VLRARTQEHAADLSRARHPHYEHLTQLLDALETCLAHGFKQPRLLKTRARGAFGPDLAELRVAEHFALAGCTIAGYDDAKRDEPVPDLVATTANGFRVAVEVYTPMAFEHLERFTDDLRSGVKNLDRSFDFYFDLEFRQMFEFDPDTMKLAYLLPDVLDAKLGESGRGSRSSSQSSTSSPSGSTIAATGSRSSAKKPT